MQEPYIEGVASHDAPESCAGSREVTLSLEMDCPEPRAVQPPEVGQVAPIREAGGLYRHYERVAA